MVQFGKFSVACFAITIMVTMRVKSMIINYVTSSNASQFVNLENLIGSLHEYAPKRAHLIVRDMGLTSGQRMLLHRYQNVQVVSPGYIIQKNTRAINVEKELIGNGDTFDERISNGDLLYVDSIRKRFQLAVVIPFIRSQLGNLMIQLNTSQVYPPCKNRSDSVDLIFYHDEEPLSSLEKDVRKIEYVNKCYQNIRFLAANLTKYQNRYPLGSAIMWQKLLVDDEDRSVSLRAHGYTHFFLMEPDTRPIRRFWLDAIVNQITDGHCRKLYFATNWWMSGSIYRGSQVIGQRFLHINGNALYHLSANFIAYVQFFLRSYLFPSNQETGYDLALFSLLLENVKLGKKFWHKFRFSDFIQNCWHSDCQYNGEHNNTQFIFDNPHTYLIHGSPLKEAKIQPWKYDHLQWILLLCIALIFVTLRRCRRFHRKLKLRRSGLFF